MDYKEKLKAIINSIKTPFVDIDTFPKYFPELKESEDEKTKRMLHSISSKMSFHLRDIFTEEEFQCFDAWSNAWLEKQGEQKPADKAKVEHLIPQKGMYYTCIKDYYSSDNTHLYVKGNVYKSPFNGYIDDESHLGLSWTNSCTEKYFEPTKDEDWIVCEHNNIIGKPMQYKEFKEKVNQKFIENLKAQGLTPKLRLWNLKDVKDGDVLYAKGSYFKEYLFMFSSFTEDNVISTHFGYDVFRGTFNKKLTRFGREEDFVSVTPATKEQRDALMKAMIDAGYEWDDEKKELKKIESDLTDFENALTDICIGWIGEELGWKQYIKDNANILLRIAIEKFNLVQDSSIEQKPTDEEMKELLQTEYEKGRADAIAEMQKSEEWHREDEQNLNACLGFIPDAYLCKWLKDTIHVKYDRPSEWSEDDEAMLKMVIKLCEQCGNEYAYYWLKSLKDRVQPQLQWKPSEGQLECLGYAIERTKKDFSPLTNNRVYLTLKALKEQLKKLREE